MVHEISRSKVRSKLSEYLKLGNKCIVTGLDSSGKSTIIKDFYPDYLTLKSDAEMGSRYFDIDDSNISWMYDHFQLFDRHGIIDHPVYDVVRYSKGNYNDIDWVISEFPDIIRNYVFFIFINDIYFNVKPHEGEFVASHRKEIKDAFLYYANKIQNITEVYIIKD